MTKKYESVLSESERNRICIQASAGKQGLQSDRSVSRATEQAVLAKLQPQLDAIGAGGVSGQRITKNTEEWVLSLDGRSLYSSDFTHDVMLRVSGDFENDDQRIEYSNGLIAKLNAPIAHQVSLGGQPFRKQPTEKQSAADALYQVVEKELLDIEMCFESFDTPQQAINALIEWHVSVPRIAEGYKLVPLSWVNEDELPQSLTDEAYSALFPFSIIDGVRMFPIYAPTPTVKDSLTTENQELRIVFSGEAPNLTFIDVENEDGFSVNAGQWHKRFDGYTELRIKAAKE